MKVNDHPRAMVDPDDPSVAWVTGADFRPVWAIYLSAVLYVLFFIALVWGVVVLVRATVARRAARLDAHGARPMRSPCRRLPTWNPGSTPTMPPTSGPAPGWYPDRPVPVGGAWRTGRPGPPTPTR